MSVNKPTSRQQQPAPSGRPRAAADDHADDHADDEPQFFEGSITKIDRDGNEVLSDYLLPGETLRRETTDRYTAVRATPPRQDKDADKDADKDDGR